MLLLRGCAPALLWALLLTRLPPLPPDCCGAVWDGGLVIPSVHPAICPAVAAVGGGLDAQLLFQPAEHGCWFRGDVLLQSVCEVLTERLWQLLPLLLCEAGPSFLFGLVLRLLQQVCSLLLQPLLLLKRVSRQAYCPALLLLLLQGVLSCCLRVRVQQHVAACVPIQLLGRQRRLSKWVRRAWLW